jgi:hypothetical protein
MLAKKKIWDIGSWPKKNWDIRSRPEKFYAIKKNFGLFENFFFKSEKKLSPIFFEKKMKKIGKSFFSLFDLGQKKNSGHWILSKKNLGDPILSRKKIWGIKK